MDTFKLFWVSSMNRKTGEKYLTKFILSGDETGEQILDVIFSRRVKILNYGYEYQYPIGSFTEKKAE